MPETVDAIEYARAEIAYKLAMDRINSGLTIAQLAERAGCSAADIMELESPHAEKAQALVASVGDILDAIPDKFCPPASPSPGPWTFQRGFTAVELSEYQETMQQQFRIYSDGGVLADSDWVADVSVKNDNEAGRRQGMANLRLMTSAPELLSALLEVRHWDHECGMCQFGTDVSTRIYNALRRALGRELP